MKPITGTKNSYQYNGISYDSKEEIWFSWYLDKLRAAGFLDFYLYQPEPFQLSDPIKYTIKQILKTKVKEIETTLLQAHSYQADFKILWTRKARNIFFCSNGKKKDFPFMVRDVLNIEFRSYIDVKPAHDLHNMTRQFIINQKWTYEKYGVYVQKIVPNKLFESTFTPERYLFTNKSLKPRKLAFKPVCLKAFTEKGHAPDMDNNHNHNDILNRQRVDSG